jgi:mRNA-degrading endonuclease RelE of RelBE toxin-antitoxin system
MTRHVELSRRATKDLRQLDKPTARRLLEVLQSDLTADPPPENLDIKPLQGAEPWLRLRVGTYRVLYRPMTAVEVRTLVGKRTRSTKDDGYLVARVIHRRDLDQAVGTL